MLRGPFGVRDPRLRSLFGLRPEPAGPRAGTALAIWVGVGAWWRPHPADPRTRGADRPTNQETHPNVQDPDAGP